MLLRGINASQIEEVVMNHLGKFLPLYKRVQEFAPFKESATPHVAISGFTVSSTEGLTATCAAAFELS